MQKRNPATLLIILGLCVASIVVSILGNRKIDDISKENAKLKTKLETLQQEEDKLKNNNENLGSQKTEMEQKINELKGKVSNN